MIIWRRGILPLEIQAYACLRVSLQSRLSEEKGPETVHRSPVRLSKTPEYLSFEDCVASHHLIYGPFPLNEVVIAQLVVEKEGGSKPSRSIRENRNVTMPQLIY